MGAVFASMGELKKSYFSRFLGECVTLLQRLVCYTASGASKKDVTAIHSETPEIKNQPREENKF